jgi:predicted signal transduction protein with EAL and GGDEF domain
VGDELLQVLASRLDESLRPGDTVARFGGDEFLIISDDLRDASDAGLIAERTLAALSRPFAIAGGEHYVSASIGIAVAEGIQRDPEDLIREADAAMYRGKERGPGNYERYDEAMRARSLLRLNIESELRRAIEGDELRVHYQPMVALDTARVLGVEALVRWEHPERGLLPPAEFIPVAEETGLILAVGERVLLEACRQGAKWHTDRPGEPPLGIAVNVSSTQVGVKLPALVAEVLHETGLVPSALSLEVTESVLVDEAESTMQALHDLKALGLKLVLDDFGTGYSSLAYVKRFPIDVLKIDRSFVSDIGTEDHDTTIVEAIISMARGLRVGVIAEGVETLIQARALQALGCTLGQGYYYARPMPADQLGLLLDGPLPVVVATA